MGLSLLGFAWSQPSILNISKAIVDQETCKTTKFGYKQVCHLGHAIQVTVESLRTAIAFVAHATMETWKHRSVTPLAANSFAKAGKYVAVGLTAGTIGIFIPRLTTKLAHRLKVISRTEIALDSAVQIAQKATIIGVLLLTGLAITYHPNFESFAKAAKDCTVYLNEQALPAQQFASAFVGHTVVDLTKGALYYTAYGVGLGALGCGGFIVVLGHVIAHGFR